MITSRYDVRSLFMATVILHPTSANQQPDPAARDRGRRERRNMPDLLLLEDALYRMNWRPFFLPFPPRMPWERRIHK